MSTLTWTKSRTLRVLDFDIENRPLSYLGMDYTTGEVTAIAAGWVGEKNVGVRLLGKHTQVEMLEWFVKLYDQADVVTGHYIRKHDLPVINGALLEVGMPPLKSKLTSDTKGDLIKAKYMSLSQENLAAMYGLSSPKEHMNQIQWREANRLTEKGLRETRRRVAGDVRQHKELRAKLIEMGVLGSSKMWRPR